MNTYHIYLPTTYCAYTRVSYTFIHYTIHMSYTLYMLYAMYDMNTDLTLMPHTY